MTNRLLSIALFASSAALLPGQQISFSDKIYPVLESAGCRNCHKEEGVASATRLHFPNEDATKARIDAFGKSLVELVDRQNPDKSLLFMKPTMRIAHVGGERIVKGSPQEATWKTWIDYLAKLPASEITDALLYKRDEASGYGVAPKVVLRRMTQSQYNNTIRDLLKDQTSPADQFPPEDFVNGFKNQYEALSVSPLLTEAYSRAAEKLAISAFRRGDSRGLLPCKPKSETDAACRTQFIQTFGRKAFRRPLEPEEVTWYQTIFRNEKTFLTGAQAVMETMLQSPSFIFWLEETPNAKWKPYAAVTRLAYFLWNSMPDDALLESAAKGEVNSAEGLDRVTRRMLADPKARDGVEEFISEWLRFDRVMNASRDRRLYPLFSRELAKSMTEEASRFVSDLVWSDHNFMDVFTANYSFINSDLAAVYKVPPPARDFQRIDFPVEAERSGVLGQALFLTLSSKPDDTGPTGRGLFVREQFLCQQVPPPPPGVDTNLPPVDENKPITNRQRMSMHASNEMCAGCHKLTDSIGFGFEKFDAIGMRREKLKLLFFPNVTGAAARRAKPKEVELELDTKAVVAGLPNADFTSPKELGAILAKTPQCQECVVKQLFRYMAGRQDTPADRPLLSRALDEFRKSDFRFKELIVALVKSKDFPVTRRTVNVASNH